jgi:hypothetical protein
MMKLRIYESPDEDMWDYFVENESVNGTFLGSRNFINYHPEERFEDYSLMITEGTRLVAVVPGVKTRTEEGLLFDSHPGSTFGGIIVSSAINRAARLIEVIGLIEGYLVDRGFQGARFKQTSELFSRAATQGLEYGFFFKGYRQSLELSTWVDLQGEDGRPERLVEKYQTRNIHQAMKHRLQFGPIESEAAMGEFYELLCRNLEKFRVKPVHSLAELLELKTHRLEGKIEFFGVHDQERLIAATMIFVLGDLWHTQYLASDKGFKRLKPMAYLLYQVMLEAKRQHRRGLSLGISTESAGRVLNRGLLHFKESFGSRYAINRTYEKAFNQKE